MLCKLQRREGLRMLKKGANDNGTAANASGDSASSSPRADPAIRSRFGQPSQFATVLKSSVVSAAIWPSDKYHEEFELLRSSTPGESASPVDAWQTLKCKRK